MHAQQSAGRRSRLSSPAGLCASARGWLERVIGIVGDLILALVLAEVSVLLRRVRIRVRLPALTAVGPWPRLAVLAASIGNGRVFLAFVLGSGPC